MNISLYYLPPGQAGVSVLMPTCYTGNIAMEVLSVKLSIFTNRKMTMMINLGDASCPWETI